MPSIIKPKTGTTVPTGGLIENELAVDRSNKRVYVGDSLGSGLLIGSSPGGSTTQVQFNDGGNFGGDAGLKYNKTTDTLTVGGGTRWIDIYPSAPYFVLKQNAGGMLIHATAGIAFGDALSLGSGTIVSINDDNQIINLQALSVVATGTISATGAMLTDTGYTITSNAISAKTDSYTLQPSDNGKIITMSAGSVKSITVPTGLDIGFNCTVMRIGTGRVTFVASSTTINSVDGLLEIASQHGAASLLCYASNTFNLSGNLG